MAESVNRQSRAVGPYIFTTNPTASNDSYDTAGIGINFFVGSLWLNSTTSEYYICTDDTPTAAVWEATVAASGGDVSFSQTGMLGALAAAGITNVQGAFQALDNNIYTPGNLITGISETSYSTPTLTYMAYDETSRTFKIGPKAPNTTFDVYFKGQKKTFTGEQTKTWTDTEGQWFFYYDSTFTLISSQIAWTIGAGIPLCTLYWDAVNDKVLMFAEERHGFMDKSVHSWAHFTVGARYISGYTLGDYTLSSNGLLKVSLTAGRQKDEDIDIVSANAASPATPGATGPSNGNQFEQPLTIGSTSPTALIPVYYRSGATAWRKASQIKYTSAGGAWAGSTFTPAPAPTWVANQWANSLVLSGGTYYKVTSNTINTVTVDGTPAAASVISIIWGRPVTDGAGVGGASTGRICYNLNTAGNWTAPEATNGFFTAAWIFGTNNIYEPAICVMGQRQDSTITAAQSGNTLESLVLTGLPFAEFKILYRLIYYSANQNTFAMDRCQLREVQDLRSVSNLPAATYAATSHSSLTSLDFASAAHTGFTGAAGAWTPAVNQVPYVSNADLASAPIVSGSDNLTWTNSTNSFGVSGVASVIGLSDVIQMTVKGSAAQSTANVLEVQTSASAPMFTVDVAGKASMYTTNLLHATASDTFSIFAMTDGAGWDALVLKTQALPVINNKAAHMALTDEGYLYLQNGNIVNQNPIVGGIRWVSSWPSDLPGSITHEILPQVIGLVTPNNFYVDSSQWTPQDALLSAYATTGDKAYVQVVGDADTDERGVAWCEGTPGSEAHKWENYIWVDEGGEFLYTYQNDVDVDILCISRGGRVGINKATNEMLDKAFFTGAGLNDLTPGGLYTGAQQLWYQVVIDATGTPDTFKWRISSDGTSWGSYTSGVSITGAAQTLIYGVEITFAATTGHTLNDQWDFVAFTQTPAGMLTVAPPRWKGSKFYNGSAYSDTLYAVSSFQSGNTTLFSGTSHFHYFGYTVPFRSINLNFSTFGAGVTNKVEYYNGGGWTEITAVSHRLVDQTSNCTKNGTVQWDRYLINDWAQTEIDGETYYWVRISTTTAPSTSPVIQVSSPSPVQKIAVYAGNLDTAPQFYVDSIGRIYGYTAKLAAQTATPPYEEGTLYYDSNDWSKSMTLMTDNTTVKHQIGQEHLIRVYNDTGGQIDDMTAVYLSGVHTDGTPKIAKSKADAASTAKCHGLATHNISNGGYGFVCGLGMVHDVNTNSWTAGDRLYVSAATAGALTNVQPSIVIPVGIVIKKDTTTGSIYVRSNIAVGLGTIPLTTGFLNSSGAGGTVGYVWDSTNKYIAIRAGATSNNTWFLGTSIASIILPYDFLSFPTSAFHASTQKNSEVSGNYMYVGVYKDAVADSSINLTSGANVWPTNTGVWEDKTLSFGSTYAAGDNLLIQVDTYVYDNAPQQYAYLRGVYILYNKII